MLCSWGKVSQTNNWYFGCTAAHPVLVLGAIQTQSQMHVQPGKRLKRLSCWIARALEH